MGFDARRLFKAVVISGAALTGCGRQAASTPPAVTGTAPSEALPPDGATATHSIDAGAGECPPESEMPMPPCYYIL